MTKMFRTMLLLVLMTQQISCEFVKYYDEDGNLPKYWDFARHPNRSCRDEDGWHRCYTVAFGVVCVMRSRGARFCKGKPRYRLKCTDNEIEFIDNKWKDYHCVTRFEVTRESANFYLPCRSTEYECKISKKCIPRNFVQDEHDDCTIENYVTDNSDETNFLPNCFDDTEFSCRGSKPRCIPRYWVMNGEKECVNGRDENTTLQCNNRTEFQCPRSKRCILRRYVNDNFHDCLNGGDEHIYNFTCIDRLEFSCEKVNGIGRCLPREWVLNGIEDCSNGEDERVVSMDCVDGEMKCLDNRRCLPRAYKCDFIQHCRDGTDEVEMCKLPAMYRDQPQRLIPWHFLLFESRLTIQKLYRGFEPQPDLAFGLKCYVTKFTSGTNKVSTKLRHVPQLFVSNNISVCANKEDNCFDSESTFTCARCLDGTIISKSQVCDGVIDCRDMSDECLCKKSQVGELCEDVFSFQNETEQGKGNIDMICNGKDEMEEGRDERYCSKQVSDFDNVFGESMKSMEEQKDQKHFTCSTSHLNNNSISNNQPNASHCNGVVDCPLKDDECNLDCIKMKMIDGETLNECFRFIGKPVYKRLSKTRRSADVRYSFIISFTDDDKEVIYTPPDMNDQNNQRNIEGTCTYMFYYKEHFDAMTIAPDKAKSTGKGLKCRETTHDNKNLNSLCDIKGVECPWLHVCDGKPKLDVAKRCDFKLDCNDGSDEENCPKHFYCKRRNPMFISPDKVGDGRSDCEDRSDEIKVTAFSSGTEMLKSTFLLYFVWFCACTIIICNVVVLRKHFQKIGKIPSKRTVRYCNVYFLICLAISDSIFGLILFTLGVKTQQFSGKYYEFDLDWRSSLTCTMIGIFTVVSSQTSVNLLILMTGLRVYVTYNSYMMKRIRFNVVVALSFVSLGVAIFLATFPIWGNRSFINFFYIKPNFFLDADAVTPSRVEDYMIKTEIISLHTNYSSNVTQGDHETSFAQKLDSWFFNTEEGRKDFPNRQIDIRGNLAFYSSSSVCFPDYFSKTPTASLYSLFIVSYNLASLILICVGYILIFCGSKKSVTATQTADEEKANKKLRKMMIKISIIVVTDILCWLPVIIMSILSYRGYVLPEIAHPLSAIVFLPINSLINPIIYSRLDKTIKRKLKKLFTPISIRYFGEETENRTEQITMQDMSNRR